MPPKPTSYLSAYFPPAPRFTSASLPSLIGKVFIITGAASGVGYELAKILYQAGGTVYIAARSSTRCSGAIEKIEGETLEAKKKGGILKSIVINLSDLATVKGAAEGFLREEKRLDVLIHNAGVMMPPAGSKDKQGNDLEMGTNCLAPYLFTLLLESLLIHTASLPNTPKSSVRIVWVTSLVQYTSIDNCMTFDKNDVPVVTKGMNNYMTSKVGDVFLADKFAKRLDGKGILSVSLHPGLMKTELQRNMPFPVRIIMGLVFKSPIYGAYSELYAGFSPEVTAEHNGGFLMAWGRLADLPHHLVQSMKGKDKGGNGVAERFIEYCDREIAAFN